MSRLGVVFWAGAPCEKGGCFAEGGPCESLRLPWRSLWGAPCKQKQTLVERYWHRLWLKGGRNKATQRLESFFETILEKTCATPDLYLLGCEPPAKETGVLRGQSCCDLVKLGGCLQKGVGRSRSVEVLVGVNLEKQLPVGCLHFRWGAVPADPQSEPVEPRKDPN